MARQSRAPNKIVKKDDTLFHKMRKLDKFYGVDKKDVASFSLH